MPSQFSFLRPAACALLWTGLLISLPRPASAELPGAPDSAAAEMANIFNTAMNAFNKGDWAGAIAGFEKVISLVTDPKDQAKIGPIHYSLAAAHFNSGNYPKAIEAFQIFLNKFPQDPRVGEARLALARATFMNKDYDGAIRLFSELEKSPALRELSLTAQAECYKQLGQPDGQIRTIEKLIAPEIKTNSQAAGGLALAELYLEKNEMVKVLDLVNKLHAKIALVDNVVALNSVTVKLGDLFADDKKYPQALAAFRAVRSRDEVLEFQKNRIAAMERRMAANLEAVKGNAGLQMSAVGANHTIKASMDQAVELMGEFEKLPDYMPGIYFRMAKVWFDWDKKWESIVVFDRFLRLYPQAKEAESALYSMIVAMADLGRSKRTQKLCEKYLADYPKGENVDAVGFMLASTSLQQNEPQQAATFFGMALDKPGGGDYREQMRIGLGNALMMQGDMAKARESYKQYEKDYPKGPNIEEAIYRDALTTLFLGDYEEALTAFRAYEANFKDGLYAADAGYRLMVCKYAANQFDEVIADVGKWQKRFPNDQIAGEVYALLGDCYAAQNKTQDAANAYRTSVKVQTSDEVLNYSIFEASKALQKLGQWTEISKMFTDFVNEHPDHPTVVAAMFWIGKAKAREGKVEEAKTFLVEQTKRYINEPKREAVEQLLQQLAQLCSKRPRPTAPPATPAPAVVPVVAPAGKPGEAPVATPVPATPPPLPPYDSVAELKKQLAPLREAVNETGRARLLYAEAELAKLRKQDAEAQKIYLSIAKQFKSTELSPVLLAIVGEALYNSGDREKARTYFTDMREDYPKSDYLDYAFVGLGEMALTAKENEKALELFSHAADEIAAMKIKEATMGKARALLELKRYAEARKLFEQVASIREWRGDTTAAAVYYLGETEAQQGHWAEAIAHYQRVFVAYQKYLPWVAKSYLRCAEAFEKLGKKPEAMAHLRELLRNEKLKDSPEAAEAQKRLDAEGSV